MRDMTPQMIARDALAGQMTPMVALVMIAGMEAWEPDDYPVWSMHADSTPAITDEVVEMACGVCFDAVSAHDKGVGWQRMASHTKTIMRIGIRAALEEFVRLTSHTGHAGKCGGPGVCWECDRGAENVRRATERAARDATVKAMTTCPVCYAPKGSGHDCSWCSNAAMADVRPKCKYCGTNHEQYGGCPAGRTDYDAHATVYAQTADDEAGRVAWATGETLNGAWTNAKIRGWIDAEKRWGKQEDVG